MIFCYIFRARVKGLNALDIFFSNRTKKPVCLYQLLHIFVRSHVVIIDTVTLDGNIFGPRIVVTEGSSSPVMGTKR